MQEPKNPKSTGSYISAALETNATVFRVVFQSRPNERIMNAILQDLTPMTPLKLIRYFYTKSPLKVSKAHRISRKVHTPVYLYKL